MVEAEGGDPDRIQDVDLSWRAFRAFLAVPLDGLFDRWEGEVEADTLVIEAGVLEWPDGPPGLLLARRFAIPAVEWHDGVPGDPSGEDDLDLDLADSVQIEIELTFPSGTTVEADDFWTAARSGGVRRGGSRRGRGNRDRAPARSADPQQDRTDGLQLKGPVLSIMEAR